jgi:dTDP-3-amino-2,3,6-trideoxy-4-keto-D-glucose/dTDP-3-amino-3,4,6-trideoxy-alpha-D-glucose/dTDP-2,6-dideoxy-D-kanosamine transaminase
LEGNVVILLNDLSYRLSAYKERLAEAANRVMASGRLVLGEEVRSFESEFAQYLSVAECVGVANGTDALELALKAVGVTQGDKVATVANAGGYTSTAMMACGAMAHFMDVDQATQLVTLSAVLGAMAAGVKAVVVTHLYGLMVPEIEQIAAACSAHNVFLIEDCAQAHGANLGGKYAGTFGHAAAFSFYPTKNLGALGDGGAVVSGSADIAARVRSLRQYGWSEKYAITQGPGKNSRLDEVQAAFLRVLLPGLVSSNARRRDIARKYDDSIIHPRIIKPVMGGENYVAHLYVIRVDGRDSLRSHLAAHDVGSDIHYPIPDHKQSYLRQHHAEVALPITEKLAAEVLTIPCFPEMPDEHVARVIDAVNSWPA